MAAAAMGVGIALRFHRFATALLGGCFGKALRLRFAEFLEPSIDTYLTLVAVVTNNTHSRTVFRQQAGPRVLV